MKVEGGDGSGSKVELVTEVSVESDEKLTDQSTSYHVSQVESLVPAGEGEASEVAVPRELDMADETPGATHNQPYVTGSEASWKNCCGLFDLLRPS